MTDYVLGFDGDYGMPQPAREVLAGSPEFMGVFQSKADLPQAMADAGADPNSAFAIQQSATIAEAITDGTNMPFTQGSFVAGKPWVFELSFTLAPGAVTETVGEYV